VWDESRAGGLLRRLPLEQRKAIEKTKPLNNGNRAISMSRTFFFFRVLCGFKHEGGFLPSPKKSHFSLKRGTHLHFHGALRGRTERVEKGIMRTQR
jgi:hypothetical protein